MAVSNVSQSQTLRLEDNMYSYYFTGTKQQIIDAGLVDAGKFPGDPGRGKTSCTYFDGEPVRQRSVHPRNEKYISIRRYGKQKFIVQVGKSEELIEKECDAAKFAVQRREKLEAEKYLRDRMQSELDAMPRSHEQYRVEKTGFLDGLMETLQGSLSARGWHGYSYDENSIKAIRALGQRMRMILTSGGTIFDAAMHQARIDQIKSESLTVEIKKPDLRLVTP